MPKYRKHKGKNKIMVSIIITSYKEPQTITKAVRRIVIPNKDMWSTIQLIVVAPDQETLSAANSVLKDIRGFKNYLILQDKAVGKPAAMNLAVSKSSGDILVFTDGDMYVANEALTELLKPFGGDEDVGGISGHPVSLDSRDTLFGFFSHVFCEAAHRLRGSPSATRAASPTPMSGYLYAIKNVKGLFPLPEHIRAEDAYISNKLIGYGYTIKYAPKAIAYVHFPKNTKDWMNQKLRSLGGNVQIASRSVKQDLKMLFFPFHTAKTPKEYFYATLLYPLRLYLWIRIYIQHITNSYSTGSWKRIESSKH